MNNIKSTIQWADYSWNPIVGCRKGCSYCYARKMNDRFHFVKDFSEPEFFPERLKEPYKLKKPSKIFVCSMGEIFDGNPEWIRQIIKVCEDLPHHTFMFLSKFPYDNKEHEYYTYNDYEFPVNCFFGLTITDTLGSNLYKLVLLKDRMSCYGQNNNNKRFISIEPILSDFADVNFSGIDLVIVGAMTGANAVKPKLEWLYSINNNKTIKEIFWKKNILKHPEL